jgi:hypothetical protein
MESDMWDEQLSQNKMAGFFAHPDNSRLPVISTAGIRTVSTYHSNLTDVAYGGGTISV